MSYLVIARKYRPQTFEDVIGQEHVTKTLINAIKLDKVHHAYIFTGPRGVGKTSISRILAKALNCEKGVTAEPCGVCKNCIEIERGSALDIREIDGASNRNIDDIRELRDSIKFSPASCRKKIYIIDEVHMLTPQAFNALLKTLEEPPAHAVFIFATTEIHEVPATILSRCQRHDFKRIPIEVLAKSLKEVCDNESVSIDDESLITIARSGDGSVRDSQSVLDQVIAYCGNNITAEMTAKALGIPPFNLYCEMTEYILNSNGKGMLEFIHRIIGDGVHIMAFLKGALEFYRNMLVYKSSGDGKLLDLTQDNIKSLDKYIKNFQEYDLLYFVDILNTKILTLKTSSNQMLEFELLLLKLVHYEPVLKIDTLLERLSRLEQGGEVDIDKVFADFEIKFANFRPKEVVVKQEVSAPLPEKKTEDEPQIVEIKVPDGEAPEGELTFNFDYETEIIDEVVADEVVEQAEPKEEKIEVVRKVQTETETSNTTKISENNIEIDRLRNEWKSIISHIGKVSPTLLGLVPSLEYCIPDRVDGNRIIFKIDESHRAKKLLIDNRKIEIASAICEYFSTKNCSIEIVAGSVDHSELLTDVKKELTPEEEKKELLEKAPELGVLFEEPFYGKIEK